MIEALAGMASAAEAVGAEAAGIEAVNAGTLESVFPDCFDVGAGAATEGMHGKETGPEAGSSFPSCFSSETQRNSAGAEGQGKASTDNKDGAEVVGKSIETTSETQDAPVGSEKGTDAEEQTAARNDSEKPCETNQGDNIPNNTYEIDGTVYKTDDNGKIYSTNGKLNPNDTYELNGNIYKTDENGRIIDVQAKPALAPENARDNDAQKDVGGNDRREGDQGGHIVGRDMGGDGGEGNLVAMDSKINQSDYKRMENDIKRELNEGKEVTTHTEISYNGDSERPDKIKVTVTADGKETVYTFDNSIDGSLREKAEGLGGKEVAETVQSVLDETGGEISSIKEDYDKKGNLEKATVNVTYKDENGTNQRTRIVIDNPQGGNN